MNKRKPNHPFRWLIIGICSVGIVSVLGIGLLGKTTTPMLAKDTQIDLLNPALSQSIESLIQQSVPNTPLGIVVQDAKTGKILYSRRATEAFLPGSTTKLFSAAAALLKLGEDYKISTTIKAKKSAIQAGILTGDLYIQFSGDPSLTVDDLKKLIISIKTNGLQTINGNIIINTSRYQKPDYALGTSQDALAWYYAAPISAVMLNGNKINLKLTSNENLGNPAQIVLAPEEKIQLPLKTTLITVSEEDAAKKCQIQINMNEANQLTINGCWPKQEEAANLKVAVKNPENLAEKIVRDLIKSENINLTGHVIIDPQPISPDLEILASHTSPPLKELLKQVLQDSNNIYADSLLKTIGAEHFQQGSFHSGILAMLEILKPLNVDFNQIRLFDGSGLSRYNLITPLQMVNLLQGIYQNKTINESYRALLAEPGVSGTLKDLQLLAPENTDNKSSFAGNIQAKTGSLHGVSSLAGYLKTSKQQDLIFAIMIDDSFKDHKSMRQFQMEFCRLIIQQFN